MKKVIFADGSLYGSPSYHIMHSLKQFLPSFISWLCIRISLSSWEEKKNMIEINREYGRHGKLILFQRVVNISKE